MRVPDKPGVIMMSLLITTRERNIYLQLLLLTTLESCSFDSMFLGLKGRLCMILRLLLHGDIGRKWRDGAAVSHLDDRCLSRGLVRTVTCGQKVGGAALVVGMEMGGLQVALPPQHPQDLLLQHGLHLHSSLQLLKPLGVLADVKALDLLVGAVHVFQGGLAAHGRAVALQVQPQTAQVDVVVVAVGAFVRTLTGVQALVQLEVDELRELCRAEFAVVRLFPRVEAEVSFQVAGAAEALVTNLAFMWLLASVDQEVFLQMSQLGEAFVTGLTFERSLTTVDTKMNLQVRQLSEGLAAHVALVLDFAVLLLQWVRQRLVAR